jgi:hypothetical protein
MASELFNLLSQQVELREWTREKDEMQEMLDLYEGQLPARFKKFFPKETPEHLVQVIPLAWDDLATSSGRLPDLRGEPRDQTQKELKAAGLLEKIGFCYLRNAKPHGKLFMKDLAWWLQIGRAVAIVTPDFKTQMPRFELRDPRTCYPGVAEKVNNRITELTDLIFKHKIPIEEARARGLAHPKQLNHRGEDERLGTEITVYEYIDSWKWCLVSQDGQYQEAVHGLGMVPGHVFGTFTPDRKAGRSRFRDQLALAVGISRLISAKMAFADKLTSSTLWTRNYEGMVELGGDTIIRLGPQGEIGQIGPTQMLQVDQDIQLLNQFSRILNRNPEVRQGEITAKGSYTSAKTLEQLDDAIDTVVGGDWDVIGPGIEYLLSVALTMDVELWPRVEKTINGNIKGKKFLDSYIPAEDIGDRRTIRVDYGFGVGGYQGFLQHLQAGDAGYMAKSTVMENMPGISDVAEEMRKMELDTIDEAAKQNLLMQAANGSLDMVLLSKIKDMVGKKGIPILEAVQKIQEDVEAQAVAAQGQDQSALTAPPMEAQAPEELPGIPPAVLAGV